MKTNMEFKNKTAVIVCHDSVFGPPHELRDYLLRHGIEMLLFIGHVNRYLHNNPVTASYVEVYRNGKLVEKHYAKKVILPEWLGYIKDIILTKWWFVKYMSFRTTYFVGLGNMNVIFGLIGRLMGTVKFSIYYVIDYSPKRFKNPALNWIYHRLDKICVNYSSITWNYSQSMIDAREAFWKKTFPNQIITPNGITIKNNLPGWSKKAKHELVYIGSLVQQQGIMFVLESLKLLRKEISDIHITIVGTGEMRKEIEDYCKINKLQKMVELVGYIHDPYEADKIISKGALGVAMYVPNTGIVAYTEPGKVKRYLSCSVPVIMTPVSVIADDLERCQCGFSSNFDLDEFASKVISFLGKPYLMQTYRKNALTYAKRFEWERIFTDCFHLLDDNL